MSNLTETKTFLKTHAFSIILVSIVFSLIMIYNILGDIKYKDNKQELTRVITIEELKSRFM